LSKVAGLSFAQVTQRLTQFLDGEHLSDWRSTDDGSGL